MKIKDKLLARIVDTLHGATIDAQSYIDYYISCVKEEKALAKRVVDCKIPEKKREKMIEDLRYVRQRLNEFRQDHPTFRPEAPHATLLQLMTLESFPNRWASNKSMHEDMYIRRNVLVRLWRCFKKVLG